MCPVDNGNNWKITKTNQLTAPEMMAMIVFHHLIKRDSNNIIFFLSKKSNYIFKVVNWSRNLYAFIRIEWIKIENSFHSIVYVCVLYLFENERIKCCNSRIDWYRYWAHNEQMNFFSTSSSSIRMIERLE